MLADLSTVGCISILSLGLRQACSTALSLAASSMYVLFCASQDDASAKSASRRRQEHRTHRGTASTEVCGLVNGLVNGRVSGCKVTWLAKLHAKKLTDASSGTRKTVPREWLFLCGILTPTWPKPPGFDEEFRKRSLLPQTAAFAALLTSTVFLEAPFARADVLAGRYVVRVART